jgi:GTP-binding protein HflX
VKDSPGARHLSEHESTRERAVLVALTIGGVGGRSGQIAEFVDLARAAGTEVVAVLTGSRPQPDARFFIGTGKADEVAAAVESAGADVVIFNHSLSPSQERNLERHVRCRVLDRAGLILAIFAQRARSHEGKLQVELAQLRHLATRLVRGWTHLERQKGGIGLRGPGETQLETDRRLLAGRIQYIERRLEKVERSREQGRQSRRRNEIPTVALVGYTNAGKSTLFNRLTRAQVYAADQLFATLDPTLRKLDLAPHRSIILADTVGFIQDLPHELIAAFKATLTETREASLLLHVVDAADPERDLHMAQVESVLDEIGAGDVPVWKVYNKIDLIPGAEPMASDCAESASVWLSAQTGIGIDILEELLARHFSETMFVGWVEIPAAAGRLRARLFDQRAVEAEQIGDAGELLLRLRLPARSLVGLLREAGLDADPEDLRVQPLPVTIAGADAADRDVAVSDG